MRHRAFVLVVATFALCLSGCAGYLGDRGRDAADIFTATVGQGVGVAARVGPVGGGLGYFNDAAGLRGGMAFAGRTEFTRPPANTVNSLPLPGFLAMGFWEEEFWHEFLDERHKAFKAESVFPLIFWLSDGDGYTALQQYTQIEASVGLVGTLRLGVNLAEIADFLVGWTSLDILDDDLSGHYDGSIYESRDRRKRTVRLTRQRRGDELLADAEAAESAAEARQLADEAFDVLDYLVEHHKDIGAPFHAEYRDAVFSRFKAYMASNYFLRARRMPQRYVWEFMLDRPRRVEVKAIVDAVAASQDPLTRWKGFEFWLNQTSMGAHEIWGPVIAATIADADPVIRFRGIEWMLRFEGRSRGLPATMDMSQLVATDPDAFVAACAAMLDRQIRAYFAEREVTFAAGRYTTALYAFTPAEQLDLLQSAGAKLEADDAAGARVDLSHIPPNHWLDGTNYDTLERLRFKAMCATRFFEVYGGLPDSRWDREIRDIVETLDDPDDALTRWKYYEFTMTMSGDGGAASVMKRIMAEEPAAMRFAAIEWLDIHADRSLGAFQSILTARAEDPDENEHVRAYAASLSQGR